nr:hypothetical protein [uncultured Prevotella sp.]
MAALEIKSYYKCNTCKSSKDFYSATCMVNTMTPILLTMRGLSKCPFYKYDKAKGEEELKFDAIQKEKLKSNKSKMIEKF